MDGVLETTIALCGCKVLCSIPCLPAFRGSVSSVSLCCICLLLFTDLSITMFLVYLWSAAPRPVSFHQSSDVIALRFMLFLSDTYEAVLMLTPLLVTVELLVHLLWGGKSATSTVAEKDAEEDTLVLKDVDGERRQQEQKGQEKENVAALLRVLGFLGCLMLWFMSGTYAGVRWRQEQAIVRSCLERGNMLSMCLPCFLTASSPASRHLFWALPTAVLLLAFAAGLSIVVAKLSAKSINPELRKYPKDFEVLQIHPPSICAVNVSYDSGVDSENTMSSCAVHSCHNERRQADGNPEPLPVTTEPGDGRKLKGERDAFILHAGRTAPYPHKSQLWQTVQDCPCLMTGLLCGLLVCVLPTVLSTNVLLVSNLDTLAVLVVRRLLAPLHGK